MSNYIVKRRRFTAKNHPKGSVERDKLNEDWLTSEYMPSHKYGLRTLDGGHTPFTFRTKREAEETAAVKSQLEAEAAAAKVKIGTEGHCNV